MCNYTVLNDNIINDIKSVATKFNHFFYSIANTINMKTPKAKKNHKQYLRLANVNSLQPNP